MLWFSATCIRSVAADSLYGIQATSGLQQQSAVVKNASTYAVML